MISGIRQWIGLAGILVLSASAVSAHCGKCGMGEAGHPASGKMEMVHEKKLKHLTEKLGLTPEQQTQVKAILDEKHTRMEQLRQETHAKITAVLTPEQKGKFEGMKAGKSGMCPEGCPGCPECEMKQHKHGKKKS